MAKMKVDFLLSPDPNSSRVETTSDGRASRSEASPFSLDYIAPPNNHIDHQYARPQHHKRSSDNNQKQHRPHASSSRMTSSKDQAAASRANFKNKKPKSPTSSSSQKTPSAEVKPHACPSCDRSFYKLEQLKRHDRLVHKNLRPFNCPSCDLSFGTKQNMQVHLTTRKHLHRLETLQSKLDSSRRESSRHIR